MTNEEWRSIKEFPNYQVSSFGRIKNCQSGKILKGSPQRGYDRVFLKNKSIAKTTKTHRLVAAAFLGEPSDNKMTVNHKNFNTLDNRADNLEWMSLYDNIMHGKKAGRCQPVGIGSMAILSIYTFHVAKYPNRHPICKKAFDISGAAYESIVNGKTAKHLYFQIFNKSHKKYQGEYFERSIFSE